MRALFGAPLVALLFLTACSDSPAPDNTPVASPAARSQGTAEHEQGRSIYNFRCYFCHGYSGDAKTLASTYLSPQPRNFAATGLNDLTHPQMLAAVKKGRPGTAMLGFDSILSESEISAVVGFVRQEFMMDKAVNTRYHTKENGWSDHDRYSAAFPFAKGLIALDAPFEQLTPEQRAGRHLYLSSCVSCHDRGNVNESGAPWESHAFSFPRNGFVPGEVPKVDATSGASPYHLHDKVPVIVGMTALEARGQTLFQDNCSFCHAADGTGRNWIGSFLQPHPRDLTSPAFMSTMTRKRLTNVIRDGLPDTSMPAWKSVLTDQEIQALVAYISKAFHPVAAD